MPSEASPETVLVVPVYHDVERLTAFAPGLLAALRPWAERVRVIIADDGSGPGERAAVAAFVDGLAEGFVSAIFHPRHRGKGGCVREAWKTCPDARWLGLVDADGSAPAAEVVRLIELAWRLGPENAVIGSRQTTASTRVVQSRFRAAAHRIYAELARRTLGLPLRDIQCGLKIIPGEAFRRIQGRLVEDGLAFDSELLVALHDDGVTLREEPVDWVECPGGSVCPHRDAPAMLRALARIRRRR